MIGYTVDIFCSECGKQRIAAGGTTFPQDNVSEVQFQVTARVCEDHPDADLVFCGTTTDKSQGEIDKVYWERNLCAATLAKMANEAGFEAGLAIDEDAEEGWKNLIFIDLPSGQISYHIPDHILEWFMGLVHYHKKWDGHTIYDKERRMLRFIYGVE